MSALFGLDMSPLLITLSEYDRQGTPGEMGVPTRLRFGNTHPDYNVSARAFLLSRRARKAIRRFMNRNAAAAGALRGDIRMLTAGADDQRGGTTRHVHGGAVISEAIANPSIPLSASCTTAMTLG